MNVMADMRVCLCTYTDINIYTHICTCTCVSAAVRLELQASGRNRVCNLGGTPQPFREAVGGYAKRYQY